jgi:hypothetical protein
MSRIFLGIFGLAAVLEWSLSGQMYNIFFAFDVFADEVLIVRGEVDDFDIGGKFVKNFRQLKETSLKLSQVLELNRVKIHIPSGNQHGQMLLIPGHYGINKRVILELEPYEICFFKVNKVGSFVNNFFY